MLRLVRTTTAVAVLGVLVFLAATLDASGSPNQSSSQSESGSGYQAGAQATATETISLTQTITLTLDPCANFTNATNATFFNATFFNATNGTHPCLEPVTEAPTPIATPVPTTVAPTASPPTNAPAPPPTPAPTSQPTTGVPPPPVPPPTPVPGSGPVCSVNASFDPYTDCNCPRGSVPADNGCCKKQCETRCATDHPNLLRSTYDPAQMDTCSGLRICNYMWGDPHAKYRDFRFDPQWNGWMLLTQCDGLKVFSYARKANRRRVTVQSQVLVQYRTSVLHVVHDYTSRTASLKAKSLDASESGAALADMPLPDVKQSVTVGEGGAQLTLSRLSATKIQICTAGGDTLKIIRVRNRALQFQSCLAPTCNLRGTGFMGIHGAEKETRFPLPNSNSSQGMLPKNGSPYQKEYMKQWYAETNRQLRGVFPVTASQFPTSDHDICHGYKLANTPAPTVPRTERYRYFEADSPFGSLRAADSYCAQQGGYLANFVTYADALQFKNDMSSARVGSSYYRSITGGTDSGVEGTWVWKYGPPATRGTIISKGRGGSSKCKQSKCFWNRGEPNNFRGNEDILEIWRGWNQWNDIPVVNHRKVICEFVLSPDLSCGKGCGNGCNCPSEVSCTSGKAKTLCSWLSGRCTCKSDEGRRGLELQETAPAPSDKLNSNSAAERLISNALAAAGVDEEMSKTAADQRNVTDGKNCSDIIAQCKSMNCPTVIFSENRDDDEQCEFAQEWIIAREVNQGLPADSPFRLDENMTSFKMMDALENSDECDATPGSHYCDACGSKNGAGCFQCPSNLNCTTDQVLTPDPATATCKCKVPAPPSPECLIDDDCQWSLLTLGITGPEYLHCSLAIGGKCLIEGGPVYVVNGTAFILLNISITEPTVTFNASHVQNSVFQKISTESFAKKEELGLQGATVENVVVGNIRRYKEVSVVRCTISFAFEQPSLLVLVAQNLNQDFTGALPMGYSVLSKSYSNNHGGYFGRGGEPSTTSASGSTSPGNGAATNSAGDGSTVSVVLGVVVAVALLSVAAIATVLIFRKRRSGGSDDDDNEQGIPGQNRAFDASLYQRHFSIAGSESGGDDKEEPLLQGGSHGSSIQRKQGDDLDATATWAQDENHGEVRERRRTHFDVDDEEDALLRTINCKPKQAAEAEDQGEDSPPPAPTLPNGQKWEPAGTGGNRGKSVIRGASVIQHDLL